MAGYCYSNFTIIFYFGPTMAGYCYSNICKVFQVYKTALVFTTCLWPGRAVSPVITWGSHILFGILLASAMHFPVLF